MAGCFGNHPFDRQMERELYRHLDEQDDYESMCEKLCEKISDADWDKYEDRINTLIDKHIAPMIEKNMTTIEGAQTLIAQYVNILNSKIQL